MAARVRCDWAVDFVVSAGRSGIATKCQHPLTNAIAAHKSTPVDFLPDRARTPMQLMHPEPAAALLGLRAMKTIASAAGPIGPAQRGLMEAAKKVILRVAADIDTLPPVTPAELAAGFPGSELRQQFAN